MDHLYSGLLGRAADAVHELAWVEFLHHGGTQDQAAVAFLSSDEFFARAIAP